MRTILKVPVVVGICLALSCAARPTAEECQQAINHEFEIMKQQSMAQMKQNAEQMGVPVPDKAAEMAEKSFQEMQNSSMGQIVRNAHLEACQHQPKTRATCVVNATTTEELVNTCGLKASGGPRGGVQISWP